MSAIEPLAGTAVDEALVAASPVPVRRLGAGVDEQVLDWVAEEVPVALQYNDLPYAVMLASPTDLEDFAIGFSLSEGVIDDPAELQALHVEPTGQGVYIVMQLPRERLQGLQARRRGLEGRSGCGLCGLEQLEQVQRELPVLDVAARFELRRLVAAMAALDEGQALRTLTGATHAAAWLTPQAAAPTWVREDVGRHNALDKLIGALTRARVDPARGAVLLTCRASLEMVQKAAAVGIGVVVARGAPTGLAVRRARALGVTLIGFARGDRLVVYTHGQRMADPTAAPWPCAADDCTERT